tara:strand:+ start:72 stop:1292 length:1221 start_codon:yes stop_codon:yes gene_type:complete
MSKTTIILFSLYLSFTNLIGQEVFLSGPGFLPYEIYYISAIDINTGESDVQLMEYIINSTAPLTEEGYNPPIEFYLQFKIELFSPELGFSEKTKLIEMNSTKKLSMIYPILLDNRDFNINDSKIIDIYGDDVYDTEGEKVKFNMESDDDQLDNIFSSITSMGKLPDGIYDFSIKLSDFSHPHSEIIESKSINITTPTSLNMIYPGGALTDTAQNLVYTPYPVFQWSTETCLTCKLFIRVANFDPGSHSSLGEAIEDVTSLPIDQIEGWHNITESTGSFSYPVIGARGLEEGKLYVWQIKKELPTTSGMDAYLSPISVFKLADPSATNQEGFSTSTKVISEPILIALKDLLGEDPFDAYFGDEGEFSHYLPNDTYRINTETTMPNDILKIIDQLQQGTISIVSISIE